jgi:hypothetical protein
MIYQMHMILFFSIISDTKCDHLVKEMSPVIFTVKLLLGYIFNIELNVGIWLGELWIRCIQFEMPVDILVEIVSVTGG